MKPGTAAYRIDLLVDPGLALRVLNLFAQRGLVPDRLDLVRDDNTQWLNLRQSDLCVATASIIAAKIVALVGVLDVKCTFDGAALSQD